MAGLVVSIGTAFNFANISSITFTPTVAASTGIQDVVIDDMAFAN